MTPILPLRSRARTLAVALLAFAVIGSGCGRRNPDGFIPTQAPEKAATGLEQAFDGASGEVQENVRLVAEAMRRREYEKAVTSLEAVRNQSDLTLDQGMAIHGSMVSMESQLIQAIEAGDPNAQRAYNLLKALKRN